MREMLTEINDKLERSIETELKELTIESLLSSHVTG